MELDFQVEETDYDVVILGTGLTESIVSAALQKNKKKVLNLDMDHYYGASLKTFNLKEYIAYFQDPPRKKISFKQIAQNLAFDPNDLVSLQRGFNLDIQPKFIYSDSLTTEIMVQANMDQYMDFQDIKDIKLFSHALNQFIDAPCSKGDIFKHKHLSLQEKRQVFRVLQVFITLMRETKKLDSDPNSLNAFEKQQELKEKDLQVVFSIDVYAVLQQGLSGVFQSP